MTIRQSHRAGFTLTELMVAIGVLVLVILATGKIFGTASQVTGMGQATADVLQEAAAFERQLRNDMERLSTEGYFAVRNVAVPNNYNIVNGNGGALLDPRLPANAMIRADQLHFFRTGIATTQLYADDDPYSDRSQISFVSRVSYGHAYQVPELAAWQLPKNAGIQPSGNDWYKGVHTPWYEGSLQWIRLSPFQQGAVQHAQIPAPQWMLGRQSVLLADDGGDEEFYLSGGENSVAFLRNDDLRRSRRDIAAQSMKDIRNEIQNFGPWDLAGGNNDQRDLIERNHLYYPRAERVAPDALREMFSLTTGTIAAACSSFQVEWTYADGVGDVSDPDSVCGDYFGAIASTGAFPQPWFGLDGDRTTTIGQNTLTFRDWQDDRIADFGYDPNCAAILPDVVERYWNIAPPNQPMDVTQPVAYTAIFGWNRTEAIDPVTGQPEFNMVYTPWPTAIRVTMTLHDSNARLVNGKTFQFVIDLPDRPE